MYSAGGGGGASYASPYRSSRGSLKGREYSRSPSRGYDSSPSYNRNETYSPVRHKTPTPSYEFRSSSAPKSYLGTNHSSSYHRSERTGVTRPTPVYSDRSSPQGTSFGGLPPTSNGIFRTRDRSPLFTNREPYGDRSVVDAIPYSTARKNNSGSDRRYPLSSDRASEFSDPPQRRNSLPASDYGKRSMVSNMSSYIGDIRHEQRDDRISHCIDRDASLNYNVNARQERERCELPNDRGYRDDANFRKYRTDRETDLSLNYSLSNLGSERAAGRREIPKDINYTRDVNSSRGRGYSYSRHGDESVDRNDGSNITINVHSLPGQFSSLPSHLQVPDILQQAGISLADM